MSKILLIEDDEDFLDAMTMCIRREGYECHLAQDLDMASQILARDKVDIVISDVHIREANGMRFLEEYRTRSSSSSSSASMPSWIFISGDSSPELVQKACELGAVDMIHKPLVLEELRQTLKRVEARKSSPILEILDIVQGIAGIQLGAEKKLLVETRLTRRARLLGLASIDQYLIYFKSNRDTEVNQLISLITTHTTEFFRESDHFDFLVEKIFPTWENRNSPIRIWSAASSSGEEAYSLAISILEYFREKKREPLKIPAVEIHGTDIDFASVEKARNGVYEKRALARMSPALISRYFDQGSGKLAEYVRVKDIVHNACKFEVMNLLAPKWALPGPFDVVFLRNVLIYFKGADISKIIDGMEKHIADDGTLFVGHSESLQGLKTGFKPIGNAVYRKAKFLQAATPSVARVEKQDPVKVMIVDDSPTIRAMLRKILSAEFGFQVVGEAAHPIEAEEALKKVKPDVITLDIHMPEMDGITYLEKLSQKDSPPVVMVSSVSYEDASDALRCFELGAVDYLEKPHGLNLQQEAERIRVVLKGAVGSKKRRTRESGSSSAVGESEIKYSPVSEKMNDLIAIGASTGGVEAIREVLIQFPEVSPPVVIVQHIPPVFSGAFARRLNECCRIRVSEAVHGELLQTSHAYIAPGGKQMKVKRNASGQMMIVLTDDEPVNRHRPSVDFLFDSLIELGPMPRVSATLLTGMGADGARGLKRLRDAGAHTIAQDEASSVVYGMPKVAVDMKAAVEILPLNSIAYHLFTALKVKKAA